MNIVKLPITARDALGARAVRRMRGEGHVPGVVYGKGRETSTVAVEERTLTAILRKGTRMVELQSEDGNQLAIFKEVQMNTLGERVLHVDFQRVAEDEKLEFTVRVIVKGTPAGAKDGAIADLIRHEVKVRCLPTQVPESLVADVSAMGSNDVLRAHQLQFPEGVEPVEPQRTVVTTYIPTEEVAAPVAAAEGPVEPEVIGRKPDEEEGEEGAAPAAGEKKPAEKKEKEKK